MLGYTSTLHMYSWLETLTYWIIIKWIIIHLNPSIFRSLLKVEQENEPQILRDWCGCGHGDVGYSYLNLTGQQRLTRFLGRASITSSFAEETAVGP